MKGSKRKSKWTESDIEKLIQFGSSLLTNIPFKEYKHILQHSGLLEKYTEAQIRTRVYYEKAKKLKEEKK